VTRIDTNESRKQACPRITRMNRERETPAKKPFAYIRVIRGPLVTFGLNENGLATCFAYLKRYPWMAVGDAELRHLTTLMVIVFPSATK